MNHHPTLDPANIFAAYVGGKELSPFHSCYANENAVLRLAAGRLCAYNGRCDFQLLGTEKEGTF